MSIEIQGLHKRFGHFVALDGIDLTIPAGQLVALLGPSGCGKTTLLRIIAGLEMADCGQILFNGEDASRRQVQDRQVGFVFQHYALFQHMSVFENVAFGLRVRPRARRPSDAQIRDKVHALLELVQLSWVANRYPSQLSGGQRQRIALARALAVEPQVLLLDEPFGALDTKVRKELRRWLRRLHDDLHITSVFVTPDQEAAVEVADQIVVMNRGHIEQVGSPQEVYDAPATPFVYQFLGNINLFHSRVHAGWVKVGGLRVQVPEHDAAEHAPAMAYVRPHDIDVLREPEDGDTTLAATISRVSSLGSLVRLELIQAPSGEIAEVEMTRERYAADPLQVGDLVFVKPRQLRVFLYNDPKVESPMHWSGDGDGI
ncbi:MAG: sulfate ABC transporter ATP-binding protein [Candidatus Competibacteraceae bacterium]|nr:sulfate ABC transporter ATP-binding protein [Candidatus Competibacteraceae bacterium]